MGILGIISSNAQNIFDGLIVIVIAGIFAKYRGTLRVRLRQFKGKTIAGIFLIILGVLVAIFAGIIYRPINTSIPPSSYWSYFWTTMGILFFCDIISIILIIVGGWLINPEATKKIINRIADNIYNNR